MTRNDDDTVRDAPFPEPDGPFGSELRDLLRPPPVGELRDRSLLGELRVHAERVQTARVRRRNIRRVSAAAAAILAILWVTWSGMRDETATETIVPVAGDVTGDGQLDVRDAYLIQFALDRGETPSDDGDHDGDGTTDAADVRRILETIVRRRKDG